MKILHTADWHLGKRLINENRYDEFAAFLSWLLQTIKDQNIEVLIVAGDVFDTMTPSNKSQELYYDFLGKLPQTGCRHAVIIAGNHDSPSFLDAPKRIFRHFNIHVVGKASFDDEVIVLHDRNGRPALIVAPAPYLRDKEIRTGSSDDIDQKQYDTVHAITQYYQTLYKRAKSTQQTLWEQHQVRVPMLTTGHLFATGATIASCDDGMRDLYVGTLGEIGVQIFCGFDYVALGHIHRPQKVKHDHIRYSGSPIALGFGEATQQKQLVLVEFHGLHAKTQPIFVPIFRSLVVLSGNWKHIKEQLATFKNNAPLQAWLSIEIDDQNMIYNAQEQLEALINTSCRILRVRQRLSQGKVGTHALPHKNLADLSPMQVFLTRLDSQTDEDKPLDQTQKQSLILLYQHILQHLQDQDPQEL